MSIRWNLVGTIIVAAALLVPVAQADDWARDGIATSGVAGSTHPDNRAAARGPGAIAANVSGAPRPDDRGDARGPGATLPTVVAVSTGNGFDWSAAVVGAAGGMGAALLLAGCAVLLMAQRNRTRAA